MVYDALLYEEAYRKDVAFVYGDIREKVRLSKCLEWADCVVWLAALVGDGACALNPEVSVQINQDSVKWLAQNYDGRIIFTSTCSVYGLQDKTLLNESSPVAPLSVYASTKLAAEKHLEKSNALIFRHGTLFGVGDRFSRIRTDLVVNTMTVRAWQQGKISVFGGEQFRPLLHVLDVADIIVETLESEATGIYNIHKENIRIVELAYQIRNHFPDVVVITKDIPVEDNRSYRVSSEKAMKELMFTPRHGIDTGIEDLKFLLETNRLRDIDSPRYTNDKFLSKFNTHLEWT